MSELKASWNITYQQNCKDFANSDVVHALLEDLSVVNNGSFSFCCMSNEVGDTDAFIVNVDIEEDNREVNISRIDINEATNLILDN